MKTRSFLFGTLCSLMLSVCFTACSDDEDGNPNPDIDPVAESLSFILNEGAWGANNAEITQFYVQENKAYWQPNYYKKMNNAKLGDLANAMVYEDENIYIVVGGSKYVARLNGTCVEQARHAFDADEGEPRCITVEDGYVYVTQYGGQVSKLDGQTLNVVATFKGGDNLEGIVEENGKLYVANTYKVDGSGKYVYNKEVLVIDAVTMKPEKVISVVDNPEVICEIDDKIYVLSKGNYDDVDPTLQVIDTQNGSAKKITNASKITKGNNGLIYGVRSAYDENYNTVNSFLTYNPSTEVVNETSFLQDAPAAFTTAVIYLLEVDEETGYIYVGTTDYTNNGTMYRFDRDGKLKDTFDSGGINPKAMIFID